MFNFEEKVKVLSLVLQSSVIQMIFYCYFFFKSLVEGGLNFSVVFLH